MFRIITQFARINRKISNFFAYFSLIVIMSLVLSLSARFTGFYLADIVKEYKHKRTKILFILTNSIEINDISQLRKCINKMHPAINIEITKNASEIKKKHFDIIFTTDKSIIDTLNYNNMLTSIDKSFFESIENKDSKDEVFIGDYFISIKTQYNNFQMPSIAIKANLVEIKRNLSMDIVNNIINKCFNI